MTGNDNEFVLDLAPSLGSVETDQTRLRQILINLLSNAGKFTHRGTVTLRAHRGPAGEVAISVQDTGIGIAAESLGRLFIEFNQTHAGGAGSYGGTGLGLAVSLKLCELLNATIDVASELGKGSTFTVRLPASAPSLPLTAAA